MDFPLLMIFADNYFSLLGLGLSEWELVEEDS